MERSLVVIVTHRTVVNVRILPHAYSPGGWRPHLGVGDCVWISAGGGMFGVVVDISVGMMLGT